MKKYMLFLATVLTTAALSCQKTETPATDGDSIRFDFNIASFEPGTKAVKSGWANGDKLNLWFDGNGANQTVPDLILTYNGSQWVAGALRSGVQANLKANGKVTLVYEGYNDVGTTHYTYNWYSDREWFYPEKYDGYQHTGGPLYASPLVVYAEKQSYTYTSNTVTATISGWKFQTCFKVLVKNDNSMMTAQAKDYCLQVKDADNSYAVAKGAWLVLPKSDETEIVYGNANDNGWARGVQEADGIAFYYKSFSTTGKDVSFELYKYDSTSSLIKHYTATSKTIAANVETKCIGLALNYSQFEK